MNEWDIVSERNVLLVLTKILTDKLVINVVRPFLDLWRGHTSRLCMYTPEPTQSPSGLSKRREQLSGVRVQDARCEAHPPHPQGRLRLDCLEGVVLVENVLRGGRRGRR